MTRMGFPSPLRAITPLGCMWPRGAAPQDPGHVLLEGTLIKTGSEKLRVLRGEAQHRDLRIESKVVGERVKETVEFVDTLRDRKDAAAHATRTMR